MADVVAPPPTAAVIPQEPTQPHFDVKLFNRWSFDDVEVTISF
jgi:small subunit ribosomal protein S5e